MAPYLNGAALSQVTQSLAVPEVHVAQEEWHTWQLKLLSTYVPSEHVLMHALPCRMGTLPD